MSAICFASRMDMNVTPEALSPGCLALGKLIFFDKGQVMFEMGRIPEKLYYVRSGVVRVVRLTDSSDRLVLISLTKGQFVCEVRFLAELPLTFQVEAHADTSVVAFDRSVVNQLLSNSEEFRHSLFCNIAGKMRSFGSALLETAYADSTSRLIRFLESVADEKDGLRSVAVSQQELAEHLGLHRVSVNRILRKLEAEGRIAIKRKIITLLG